MAAETINVVLANKQITSNRPVINHGDILSICSRDDDFHQPYSVSEGNRFGTPKAKEKEMLSRDNCRIVKVKNTTEGVLTMKIFDRFNPSAYLVLSINPKPRPPKKGSAKSGAGTQFYAPNFEDKRLAYCYTPARECGEKAATTWCIRRGFVRATSWEIYGKKEDPKLQARFIGTKKTCRPGACDTFRSITCR
ncbi:MAG: hypothetical protein R3257_03380 [bacterium]|nr:hypothetical protein [bacterium]